MAVLDNKNEEEKRRRRTVEVLNGTDMRRLEFGGGKKPSSTGPAARPGNVAPQPENSNETAMRLFNDAAKWYESQAQSMRADPYQTKEDRNRFREAFTGAVMPSALQGRASVLQSLIGGRNANWQTGRRETGQDNRAELSADVTRGGQKLAADVARGGQNIDALGMLAGMTQPQGGGNADKKNNYNVNFDEQTGQPTYVTEQRGDRTYTYPHTSMVNRTIGGMLQNGNIDETAAYVGSFYQDYPEDMRQEKYDQAMTMIRGMTTPEQQRRIVDKLYGKNNQQEKSGGWWPF